VSYGNTENSRENERSVLSFATSLNRRAYKYVESKPDLVR